MTNNVKTPRYLDPSEIELWELSKKARPDFPWLDDLGDELTEFDDETADFIRGLSPAKTLSLLETLEKTREALRLRTLKQGGRLFTLTLGYPEDGEPTGPFVLVPIEDVDRAKALLSGFSGDASKEEK